MSETLYVRPADPAREIVDPVSRQPLPSEGGEVSNSAYWRRRLAAGDVVMVRGDDAPPKKERRR